MVFMVWGVWGDDLLNKLYVLGLLWNKYFIRFGAKVLEESDGDVQNGVPNSFKFTGEDINDQCKLCCGW